MKLEFNFSLHSYSSTFSDWTDWWRIRIRRTAELKKKYFYFYLDTESEIDSLQNECFACKTAVCNDDKNWRDKAISEKAKTFSGKYGARDRMYTRWTCRELFAKAHKRRLCLYLRQSLTLTQSVNLIVLARNWRQTIFSSLLRLYPSRLKRWRQWCALVRGSGIAMTSKKYGRIWKTMTSTKYAYCANGISRMGNANFSPK